MDLQFHSVVYFYNRMCFEEVKADPVFVCTIITDHATGKQMPSSEQEPVSVYQERELEVTETIAVRDTTSAQQLIAPMTNGRRTLKLSVALVYITVIGLLLSNSYAMAYVTQLPERVCKSIVVNYIHNTDGKKRV